MKLRLPVWLRGLISATLVAVLIAWIGPRELIESLATVKPGWLALSVAASYVAISLGLANALILTRALLPDVSTSAVAGAYLRSWAAGMLAPGKIGDLSYAHFLSSDDTNLAPGLAVGIVDKLITFVIISAIAIVGLLLFVGEADALLATGIAVFAVAGSLVALSSTRLRAAAGKRLLGRTSAFDGFGTHTDTLLRHRPRTMVLNTCLTLIRTLVQAVAVSFGLLAFGAHARLLDVVFVHAIATLVSLVPVTLSGLGARQGISMVLFDRIAGIPNAVVLNETLIGTAINYLNVGLIMALLGIKRRD